MARSSCQQAPFYFPVQIAKILAAEKDDDSPQARTRRKQFYEGKREGARLSAGDSLNNALAKAIRASDEAERLLLESMVDGKTAAISARLSIHTRALQLLLEAETACREEQERRRILIPLAEAKDITRKGYDIVLSRLRCLPQSAAHRCNPSDPHRAMAVLESECVAIIADAQEAYAVQ
jgi:hypothetical protein